MAEPALRAIAAVGVLATGLLFGGVTPPAGAQPDDSGGSSQDSGGSAGSGGDDSSSSTEPGGSGGSGRADDGGSRITDPDPATNTGTGTAVPGDVADTSGGKDTSGGTDTSGGSVAPGGESRTNSPPPPQEAKKPEDNTSISIPMVRLPAAGEIAPGSWPTVSTFYTTVEIPVPTFEEFLAALRGVTTPAPAPGPAFRTQEEAPVADATTGTTSGGGGAGGPDVPVLRAPLVRVPRAVTVAGAGAKPTVGLAAGGWAEPGVMQPGAAGARTPVIRGSLPPTPGVASVPTATPMSGQGARIGYPRYMRGPTVTELAVVALPGLAGMLLLTFSGGLIGYRQANSVRFVRTAGAERFLL